MNARKVAAQFAARVWYEEIRAGKQSPKETADFARKNWQAFLPVAPEGLGKLLIQIAGSRPNRRRHPHTLRLAAAS